MANIFTLPYDVILDTNGDPVSGAKINFYVAGSSTRQDTYSDYTRTVLNANPVEADSAGRFGPVYLKNARYKIIVTDAADSTIKTVDNYEPPSVDVAALLNAVTTTGSANAYVATSVSLPTAYSTGMTIAVAPNFTNTGAATINVNSAGAKSIKRQSGANLIPGMMVSGGIHLLQYDGTQFILLTPNLTINAGVGANFSAAEGRLTLTSGSAVMSADVTAATTLYYTQYKGNRIGLYDTTASQWSTLAFSEASLSLSGRTADTNYDVFVYNNSGNIALELLAWTNDTTRATALTAQDGILVKNGDASRRYVGTIRTTGTTGRCEFTMTPAAAAGGTANKLYVWNMYNRVPVVAISRDSSDSWNYTTATWRALNNSASNRISYVSGLSEGGITAQAFVTTLNTNAGVTRRLGIGLDSTSGFTAGCFPGWASSQANDNALLVATYRAPLTLGHHYLSALEYSSAAGTSTWYGDGGDATTAQAGLQVTLEM